ncbi:MAG: AbrB/MazE/SpoVT family DNA-binding domain-containing protein [Oxalobacteraceae bacterium]
MSTTLTVKGQVTIPKQIRDALKLKPGSQLDFALNEQGQVILRKVGEKSGRRADRFDSVRGKAEIRWRTDDLMALLRAD